MRIIIIDPFTTSIYERDKPDSIRISRIIGGLPTSAFVIRHPAQVDYCYVDDEGLLKYDRYFTYRLGHQPYYAGIGVIEGIDAHGRSLPAKTDLAMLTSMIRFYE